MLKRKNNITINTLRYRGEVLVGNGVVTNKKKRNFAAEKAYRLTCAAETLHSYIT